MAFIPEAIISKVVEELIALPMEELKQEVKLVVGVKDQVRKLTKNLKAIQAVVADAERKQIKDSTIKLWLEELKEISYEMDDVVDEWRSEMLRRSHNLSTSSSSHTKKKVCPFITFSCFRFGEVGLRRDIALKIKELNGKLNEIAERRNNYNLVPHVGVGLGEQAQQRTTISVINMMKVKGRDKEKEQIINMLLSTSSDEPVPQIISIVGMGGLGKTTLAQVAYNDARVEKYFDKKIWVCVSDPFDEMKIANAILESLGGVCGTVLQRILQDIRSRIVEKKYLLVLDDVWNEEWDKWSNLSNALTCGLPGSTILVTTRSATVARIMGCKKSKTLRPGVLFDEECWSIICHEVELFGKTKEDLEQLQDIGKQIAKKCKGLPLAAKALGGLLCFKDSRQEWQSVLDSEMWQLGEEETKIGSQLFALYLSYLDLSSVDKLCLSYCVFYPKDFPVLKDDLVKTLMAQGYLTETNTKDMEMVVEESFRNISSRSFFQDFEKDYFGKIKRFKMHDIVHDFIQFISKKEYLSSDQFEDETVKELDKSLRHLFFLPESMDKFGKCIFSFKKLRSLKVSGCERLDLCRLFNELTCLRSLNLSGCDIREIPSEIGRLIHLRLLDISKNDSLSELPETIGELCNMLIFNTLACYDLMKFPHGIEKLLNLRYFLCEGVGLTKEMGRLYALREAKFYVESEACSLGNLNNLNHLSFVDLYLGRQVKHMSGAKQAQLNKKKHLVKMIIAFRAEHEGVDFWEIGEEEANRWKAHDEEVIEALQPCSNLEDLKIASYMGANPNPSWLMSLQHLKILELYRWKNCNNLPTLGKLASLTHLSLRWFTKVKKVGADFFGIDETLSSDWAFPKLESLKLSCFLTWEEWEMKDWFNFSMMPCLTALTVIGCSKLKALPHHLLQKTTIKELNILCSSLLEERYKEYKGVDWPKISHIPRVYM